MQTLINHTKGTKTPIKHLSNVSKLINDTDSYTIEIAEDNDPVTWLEIGVCLISLGALILLLSI